MEEIRRIKRELIHRGKIVNFYEDTMSLPNGNTAVWDYIEHKGAAAVVPVTKEGKILMVRQYRNALERYTLEIPAGKLDEGEEPAAGALRELKEETGAVPDVFLPLGRLLPSPGCFGETLHLFLARGLRMEAQHLDPDEFLNVERIPFDEMVHRCVSSEIEDAKTVAAVLRAKVLLNL
jgi:ADP-ribose pyrophosphatase